MRHRQQTAKVVGALASVLVTGLASAQSAPAATGDDDSQSLDRVVVTGHTNFLGADTQGTTNLPVPVEQVPQTIDIVTQDFIQTANLKTLGDIASFTPGAINAGNPENNGSIIQIRGFTAGRAIDGINTITSYNPFEPDFAIYDRLEIVEGPASVTYGISSPGGLVNYVTKSATSQTPSYIYAQTGSFNEYRLEGQIAKTFGDEERIHVIGVAAVDDGDSFTTGLSHRNAVLYGGVNAELTDTLSGFFHAGYETHSRPSFDGIPTEADGTPAPVPRSFFLGSNNIRIDTTSEYATQGLTWSPSPLFDVSLKSNYETDGLTGGNSYGSALQDNGDVSFNVERFDGVQRTTNYGVGLSAVLHFDPLGLKDSFLSVSALYQDSKEGTDVLSPANEGTANIFAGQSAVTGAFDALYNGPLPYPYIASVDTKNSTISAQSIIKPIDRLAILLGVSYSKPQVDTATNGVAQNFDFPGQESTRAGVTYEIIPHAFAYASYSESFEPQALLDVAGAVLPPVSGKQEEVGIKYRPSNGLLLSGAVYRIVENNVGQYDTTVNGVDFYTPVGQVTNKGFEIKALGKATRNLEINAGFSYLDPKVSKDSDPTAVGQTQLFLPKRTFSLYAIYKLPGEYSGFSIGGGYRYIGSERTAYDDSTKEIPSYSLTDVNFGYDKGPWSARLTVSNLFNKNYYTNNYQTLFYGNVPGTPTTVALSLRRTFE